MLDVWRSSYLSLFMDWFYRVSTNSSLQPHCPATHELNSTSLGGCHLHLVTDAVIVILENMSYYIFLMGVGRFSHWGWVTHICIVFDWCQAIVWTNATMLSTRPQEIYFTEILFTIQKLSFKKMHLNMSVKWWPFCLSLNVLPNIMM